MLPLCSQSLCLLENMIVLSQMCLRNPRKPKFLGDLNRIVNFPQNVSFIGLELSLYRHFPQLAHLPILVLKNRQIVNSCANGACEDTIPRKGYMKTPTPKKGDGKSIVKCGHSKGSISVTTSEKGKIPRHFQSLGGETVWVLLLRQQGNLNWARQVEKAW